MSGLVQTCLMMDMLNKSRLLSLFLATLAASCSPILPPLSTRFDSFDVSQRFKLVNNQHPATAPKATEKSIVIVVVVGGLQGYILISSDIRKLQETDLPNLLRFLSVFFHDAASVFSLFLIQGY